MPRPQSWIDRSGHRTGCGHVQGAAILDALTLRSSCTMEGSSQSKCTSPTKMQPANYFGVCVTTTLGARSSASSCGLRLDDGLAHAAQMPPVGAINVLDPLPQNPSSRGPDAYVRRGCDMGAARTDRDDEQGPDAQGRRWPSRARTTTFQHSLSIDARTVHSGSVTNCEESMGFARRPSPNDSEFAIIPHQHGYSTEAQDAFSSGILRFEARALSASLIRPPAA